MNKKSVIFSHVVFSILLLVSLSFLCIADYCDEEETIRFYPLRTVGSINFTIKDKYSYLSIDKTLFDDDNINEVVKIKDNRYSVSLNNSSEGEITRILQLIGSNEYVKSADFNGFRSFNDEVITKKKVFILIKPEFYNKAFTNEDLDLGKNDSLKVIVNDDVNNTKWILVSLPSMSEINVLSTYEKLMNNEYVQYATPYTVPTVSLCVCNYCGAMLPEQLRGQSVSARDARHLLRVSAKIEETTPMISMLCDFDGNEKITAEDAQTLLKMAARLEPNKFRPEHTYDIPNF